jgi:hypothetical protein
MKGAGVRSTVLYSTIATPARRACRATPHAVYPVLDLRVSIFVDEDKVGGKEKAFLASKIGLRSTKDVGIEQWLKTEKIQYCFRSLGEVQGQRTETAQRKQARKTR